MRMGLGDGGAGAGGSDGGAGGGGGSGGSGSAGGGTGSAQGGAASGSSGAASGSSGTGNAGGAGSGASGGAQGGTMGAGGGQAASWRDSLPDDLKADPTLSKYSDIANLSKAHIELQKLMGQKGIFKPGKDASAEEIKRFREDLGIPTDPEKYDMGKFEGVEVPEVTLKWARDLGAKHGIEPAALKAVMTDYMKLEGQLATQTAAKAKTDMLAGLDSLKTEWGDGYDRNISRANYAAEKLGGKTLIDQLVKLGVQNDPVLLKTFAEAAKLFGEDRLREAGAGDGRETPQELSARIAAVDARIMSMRPTDGAYRGLLLERESLYKQKTGGR